MSTESENNFIHIATTHQDINNVGIDNDYEINGNTSDIKWNEILHQFSNYNFNHDFSQHNFDSSTFVSESIVGSNSDYCDFENIDDNLNARPAILEKENYTNISVEHSSDVLFGNKTLITGPVLIKTFIAENDTFNGNQRDKSSDPHYESQISGKEKTSIKKRLYYAYAFFKHRPVAFVTVVVGIVLIVSAVALGAYFLKLARGSLEALEEPTERDYFEFINRSEYNALPRRGILLPLSLPVTYVIIAHTEGQNCTDLESCKEVARHIQWYHMNINGWDEVGLNFMIGGDGRVYEGSGYEEGAHTLGYNFDSVCISFIGNFTEYEPEREQFVTAKLLIDDGIKQNKIQSEYVLYAHRQIRGGDSPGKYVYDEIISWEHWSEQVIPK